MTRFIPLNSNTSEVPTLFLDTQAPPRELLADADFRFTAVRKLLDTLICLDLKECTGKDFSNIASIASLLLESGHDLMRAAVRSLPRDEG